MWFDLEPRAAGRASIVSRQAISAASNAGVAELVVTTRSELDETVMLATGQVLRLGYHVARIEGAFELGGAGPVPWPEAGAIAGRGFEIMLTSRGASLVPAQGPRLPNRLASWLATVAEDVRCAWPAIPDELAAGSSWSGPPVVPGGLPPGAVSAEVTVGCRVLEVTAAASEIRVEFALRALLERSDLEATAAEGTGTLSLRLEKRAGPVHAVRESTLSLARPSGGGQVVRATMELRREPVRRT